LPCPPTDGLTYKPVGLLSGFNGQTAAGTWTLSVQDNANQDGGSLTNWALELCVNSPVGIKEHIFLSPSMVYPNPTAGLLNVQLGGEANEVLKIKIVNTLGQVLETRTATCFCFNRI
jgi:subtilisin-like proprotein convertase family protein